MNKPNYDLTKALLVNKIFPIFNSNFLEDDKTLELIDQDTEQSSNLRLLGTFLSNLAYYGFAPNKDVLIYLKTRKPQHLKQIWKNIEPILKEIKGNDIDMQSAMVYKNFPYQTLSLSDAQYWIYQSLIYNGASIEEILGEQKIVERDEKIEKLNLKVLSDQRKDSFEKIFQNLIQKPTLLIEGEIKTLKTILLNLPAPVLNYKEVSFKANATILAGAMIENDKGVINIDNATDVLRLASYLSGSDPMMKTQVKFKSFSKPVRKKLLTMLEGSKNLQEDISARKDIFKRLLKQLHPGDYKKHYPKVIASYDLLYKNELSSFAGLVDKGFKNKDDNVFTLLKSRPGEFVRRFYESYNIFGEKSVEHFCLVVEKLDNFALLKFKKYLQSSNQKMNMLIAPKGQWNKLKVLPNNKTFLQQEHIEKINKKIENVLTQRMKEQFPDGILLDPNLENVKIATGEQELESYGRGTVFQMPQNTTFVRSASYWETPNVVQNVWFDNGWNFFDSYFSPVGTICWNNAMDGANFSGDPTNSSNSKKAGCQVIDLDLSTLQENGVQYAVWNILGYSNLSFDGAKIVRGLLQFGQNSFSGEIFEPSRVHQAFDLKGSGTTKYVCIVDVVNKNIIYLDGNLKANVSSAKSNETQLSSILPDLMQYLKNQPSIVDLMMYAPEGSVPFLYSDKDVDIEKNSNAFVFVAENKNNVYESISINNVLKGQTYSLENKQSNKKLKIK